MLISIPCYWFFLQTLYLLCSCLVVFVIACVPQVSRAVLAHTYQLAFHRSGLALLPVRAPRKRWACVDKNGISRWGPVPDFCWVVKETMRAKIRYWTLGVRILQLPAHPARPTQPPRQLCPPTSARQPALGFLSMKWGCLSPSVGELPADIFRETVP